MSSELEIIALLSAWANTHLTATGCSTDNILTGLMEGETMKVLLESMQLACMASSMQNNKMYLSLQSFADQLLNGLVHCRGMNFYLLTATPLSMQMQQVENVPESEPSGLVH